MTTPNVYAQVPIEILQRIAPLAEQLGIAEDLPGITRIAPTIDLSKGIRMLALEMGQLLSKQNLFLRGDDVVTIDELEDESPGKIRRMTAKRFVGYVEEFCAFQPGRDSKRARHSLTREEADLILDQDIFKRCLRPLDAVHLMRLPVRRKTEDGKLKIDFLPAGYDLETRIYTVEKLKYATDWTVDEALEWIDLHGAEYPLAWPGEERGAVAENRNWAVQVMAMVGVYCKAMFKPGTVRPMVTYIGNQQGTGKSTLAAMALFPVFGNASTTDAPQNDETMSKTLETAARAMRPYLFFDDIRYGLDSSPLNRFITSTSHTGRCFGGNSEMFEVDQVTQVFATGNQLKITKDLARRSLIVELFLDGDAKGRKHRFTINPDYLAREDIRKKFLSAFCALVRNFSEILENAETSPLHSSPIESFEEFTSLVGGIVTAAGYSDPLQAPDISLNEDEDEMRELLIKVASEANGNEVYNRQELVTMARANGLLESLVGTGDSGELDQKSNKRFGRQLQKWRGRKLVDAKGRRFQFGHRRQKSGATYPLQFVT